MELTTIKRETISAIDDYTNNLNTYSSWVLSWVTCDSSLTPEEKNNFLNINNNFTIKTHEGLKHNEYLENENFIIKHNNKIFIIVKKENNFFIIGNLPKEDEQSLENLLKKKDKNFNFIVLSIPNNEKLSENVYAALNLKYNKEIIDEYKKEKIKKHFNKTKEIDDFLMNFLVENYDKINSEKIGEKDNFSIYSDLYSYINLNSYLSTLNNTDDIKTINNELNKYLKTINDFKQFCTDNKIEKKIVDKILKRQELLTKDEIDLYTKNLKYFNNNFKILKKYLTKGIAINVLLKEEINSSKNILDLKSIKTLTEKIIEIESREPPLATFIENYLKNEKIDKFKLFKILYSFNTNTFLMNDTTILDEIKLENFIKEYAEIDSKIKSFPERFLYINNIQRKDSNYKNSDNFLKLLSNIEKFTNFCKKEIGLDDDIINKILSKGYTNYDFTELAQYLLIFKKINNTNKFTEELATLLEIQNVLFFDTFLKNKNEEIIKKRLTLDSKEIFYYTDVDNNNFKCERSDYQNKTCAFTVLQPKPKSFVADNPIHFASPTDSNNNLTINLNADILKNHKQLCIQNAGNQEYTMSGSGLNEACSNFFLGSGTIANKKNLKIKNLSTTPVVGIGLNQPSTFSNNPNRPENYQLYMTSPKMTKDNQPKNISLLIVSILVGMNEINIHNKGEKSEEKLIKSLFYSGQSDSIFIEDLKTYLLDPEDINKDENITYKQTDSTKKFINIPQIISGLFLVASSDKIEKLDNVIIGNPAISYIVTNLLDKNKHDAFIKKLEVFLNNCGNGMNPKIENLGTNIINLYKFVSKNEKNYLEVVDDTNNYSNLLTRKLIEKTESNYLIPNILDKKTFNTEGYKSSTSSLNLFKDFNSDTFVASYKTRNNKDSPKTISYIEDLKKDVNILKTEAENQKKVKDKYSKDNKMILDLNQYKIQSLINRIEIVEKIEKEENSEEDKKFITEITENYLNSKTIKINTTLENKESKNKILKNYFTKELEYLPNKTSNNKDKFSFDAEIKQDEEGKIKLILSNNSLLFKNKGSIEILLDGFSTAYVVEEIRSKGLEQFIKDYCKDDINKVSIYSSTENPKEKIGPEKTKFRNNIQMIKKEYKDGLKSFSEKAKAKVKNTSNHQK